jgi:hypothetical protein
LLSAVPLALVGCAVPATSVLGISARKARAQWEYHNRFLASGARLRFRAHSAHGRPWTSGMEQVYRAHRRDPRVGYAVKNLHTGRYLAEFQADRLFVGGSMPKPAVAATLLEKRQGNLTREEFQHIVYVCDKSINASWFTLLSRITLADEQHFEQKYNLPNVQIINNQQSPRFYAEFYERCVNYRLDYGCELLLEAMRRDQYGLGRWVMPASITYIGGKTGNYGEWDHESLFFYHRGTPFSIVLYTRGHFAPGNQLGCMMGGLFREYCA